MEQSNRSEETKKIEYGLCVAMEQDNATSISGHQK
jgi:hypothetical protein